MHGQGPGPVTARPGPSSEGEKQVEQQDHLDKCEQSLHRVSEVEVHGRHAGTLRAQNIATVAEAAIAAMVAAPTDLVPRRKTHHF